MVKESARPAFVGECLEVKCFGHWMLVGKSPGKEAGTLLKVVPRPTINQRYNPDAQVVRAFYQQEILYLILPHLADRT